jgi:hypothetical protein
MFMRMMGGREGGREREMDERRGETRGMEEMNEG